MEEKYEPLKLSKQLCFPLYACSREMIKLYKPWLDELGLTYTQYITMMVLWEHKSMTVKALGQELYLDSGTLTPLLKKLEDKGLVTRRRSDRDERNLIVTITEQGEAMKDAALHIPGEMTKCINLPREDIRDLYRMLHQLLEFVK
ncbi:MAG: MarR family transcriptional regulator [Oscillospiraceae bacterium]|nr:MarR family transcriptional regulator [Oscillospiraceae bacterium]MBQ7099933.1 MarR family transcriptional regulator [Oscillospiraceae bacterium]